MNASVKILAGLVLALSLFSPLIYNIVSFAHNCENVCDFSIYQQAIYDSFALKNPNPFLTIRNTHILQDHFDPIYLLAGPWAALFDNSPYSLLVFEWLFLLATLGVLIHFSKDNRSLFLWSFLLLWNRGIIHAVGYPLHPTTWSMLPITLMVLAIKEKREKLFWISTLSLLLFKEIFPVATLGLSLGFLATKNHRKGVILLGISLLFCCFNFYGRTLLLEGEAVSYAANFLKPWTDHFGTTLLRFPLKSALKYLLPGVLILCWTLSRKKFTREDFLTLSFWLPILLIQTVALRFDYHNSVMLCWPPLLLLWGKEHLLTKQFFVIFTIAYIYTGFTSHKKNYLPIFSDRIKVPSMGEYCELSRAKRESIKKVKSLVWETPIDSTLLGTGGIIPAILRPKAKVYHIGGYSPRLEQYDFLLLGRREDFYPLKKNQLERIWANCLKSPPSRILFSDDYHTMVQGPVSGECL